MSAFIKIGVDVAMVLMAVYFLIQGLAGKSVGPVVLIIAAVLMILEEILDLAHMH